MKSSWGELAERHEATNGYVRLAKAVIASGAEAEDFEFLRGDGCEELCDYVGLEYSRVMDWCNRKEQGD